MDFNSINKTASLIHDNRMSLMIFQMEHEFINHAATFYGINVFKVREVIEGQRFPVAKTPNSHSLIEGMIQLRGNFIPVIDMPTWLGCPMDEEAVKKSVIIVCDFSHNVVGFRVAHIHGVEEKSWNDLHPAENISAGGVNRVVNQTTVKHNNMDELCYIIDVEGLLAECMPDMADRLKPVVKDGGDWVDYYKGKILLAADDSKSIREYIKLLLTQLGIEHRIFENGKELINFMDSLKDASSISAILTDLEMPEASGHEVVKFIRGNQKFKALPVAVHSSMTSDNNARDAKALGANYFIGKINTDELTSALKVITK